MNSTVPRESLKLEEAPGSFIVPELFNVVTVRVLPAMSRVSMLLAMFNVPTINDVDDAKLRKAKALGATYTINSQKEDLSARVEELSKGDGVNLAIEAVGLPQTFRAAVDLVCFGGRVVYIGYAKKPVEYETKLFVSKEVDIMGSRNAFSKEIDDVIGMFRCGRIDVSELVTHRFRLDEMEKALKFWDTNPGEVTKILLSV